MLSIKSWVGAYNALVTFFTLAHPLDRSKPGSLTSPWFHPVHRSRRPVHSAEVSGRLLELDYGCELPKDRTYFKPRRFFLPDGKLPRSFIPKSSDKHPEKRYPLGAVGPTVTEVLPLADDAGFLISISYTFGMIDYCSGGWIDQNGPRGMRRTACATIGPSSASQQSKPVLRYR